MLKSQPKVEDHENHVRWIYLTTVLYMGESQKYARTIKTTSRFQGIADTIMGDIEYVDNIERHYGHAHYVKCLITKFKLVKLLRENYAWMFDKCYRYILLLHIFSKFLMDV